MLVCLKTRFEAGTSKQKETRAAFGAPMRSFWTWFLILLVVLVVAPYALGVRPRTRRDWFLIALISAFLMWLLPGLEIPLRSR